MTRKLTEADIDAVIEKETVTKIGLKTTLVHLRLKNGFEVVGTSACVDPAAYSEEIGTRIARGRAKDKIWELEGYRLQCQIADAELDTQS